jgi:hypothetical protein
MCFILWNAQADAKSGDKCDRLIDLAIGKADVDSVPMLERALLLGSTNQFEQEQMLISEHAWWQLEEAWVINRKYDGALEIYLTPILLHVYPQLKQQVDLSKFSRWPKPLLIEMTNFMVEADALLELRRGNNKQ